MIKKKVKIKNPQGLHARPASLFVKIANKYESDVVVRKGADTVSGKSIMGLMTLAANRGSVIEIEVNGADAERALRELEEFLLHDEDETMDRRSR
ncbi:MAG: HPr family phosphocarrier protein [Candidatus Omnitrophica bacterium]|nr:HPr family phosphocarrier protein [Candidatus Omnitrophota bacterium]